MLLLKGGGLTSFLRQALGGMQKLLFETLGATLAVGGMTYLPVIASILFPQLLAGDLLARNY